MQTVDLYYKEENIFAFSASSLKVSPTNWNSMCLSYNSKKSTITIAINEYVKTKPLNVTLLDIQSKITVGTTYERFTFSGQIADFNIWNQSLNETMIKAYINCSHDFQQRLPLVVLLSLVYNF